MLHSQGKGQILSFTLAIGPLNNYNFYERNLGQEKQKDLLTVLKHKRDSHESNNSTSCC